jgi:AraC-like DNA-binding protein
VRYCLTNAHTAPTVEHTAAALGVRRQTIAARLAVAMLPTASSLVSWGRLLLAARLLEDAERSVERVAHALAFDSGSALRHMLMRYTGLRPAQVRARGGLAEVLPLFVAGVVGGRLDHSRVAAVHAVEAM